MVPRVSPRSGGGLSAGRVDRVGWRPSSTREARRCGYGRSSPASAVPLQAPSCRSSPAGAFPVPRGSPAAGRSGERCRSERRRCLLAQADPPHRGRERGATAAPPMSATPATASAVRAARRTVGRPSTTAPRRQRRRVAAARASAPRGSSEALGTGIARSSTRCRRVGASHTWSSAARNSARSDSGRRGDRSIFTTIASSSAEIVLRVRRVRRQPLNRRSASRRASARGGGLPTRHQIHDAAEAVDVAPRVRGSPTSCSGLMNPVPITGPSRQSAVGDS